MIKNELSTRTYDHWNSRVVAQFEVYLHMQILARAKYNIIQCVKLEQILQKLSPPTSLALKFLNIYLSSFPSDRDESWRIETLYKIALTN